MAQVNEALVSALLQTERDYSAAIDRLRSMDAVENSSDAWGDTGRLREAVELVRCLRRLVAGVPVGEIHRAFGAPGDFGYETPIGDALYRLYQGKP